MPIFTVLQIMCGFERHHINYTWGKAAAYSKRNARILRVYPRDVYSSRILMYRDFMNHTSRFVSFSLSHTSPYSHVAKQQQALKFFRNLKCLKTDEIFLLSLSLVVLVAMRITEYFVARH